MFTEFGKFLAVGGLPVYALLILGGFAVTVVWERFRALFLDFPTKSEEFGNQIKKFILNDQIEEAVAFCSNQGKAVLPKVVKTILERADRDDENIKTAQDIGSMEIVPAITKRLGYLAMIANVATLIGLLGTIHGLIQSFQAVSFADPAQKQTLLAQGISISMNTTALGLIVAIPVMIIYSFFQAQQNKILEEIIRVSAMVVDLLLSRNYLAYEEGVAYPSGDKATEVPGKSSASPKKKAG